MINITEKIDGVVTTKSIDNVSFDREYDIVVAGLGTAGAVSIITAAHLGKKVLGIERFSSPGGTMTIGGVGGYYFGGKGGLYEKIDEAMKENNSGIVDTNYIHTDHRKCAIDNLTEKSGADVMYESIITGIYAEDKKIVGVRVFCSEKEENIRLKALIDATGDGDICDMAGCSMSFGRADDNSVVPYSVVKAYMKNGKLMKTNHDCGKVDQRDVWAFSDSLMKAYSVFMDDYKEEVLARLQPLPGIREGRLLDGEEKITFSDVLSGKTTDKPVIFAYSDFDKHGIDIAFDSELSIKWQILSNLGALNVTIGVPLGALVAKEYDNLMVAGRCLSVDHDVATHIRMNRDMQKLGEVAATASAFAIDGNVRIIDVPYEKLKSQLEKTGCLNNENNIGFYYGGGKDISYNRQALWMEDKDKLNEALSTLSPGLAIWSARLMGEKIVSALCDNLDSKNENLRKHSAIALAVMNKGNGKSVLREMVENRDRTMLCDMRKQNKRRISQALCALGILGDEESIDIILKLVSDRKEHTFYPFENGYNPCYYRTLSSAVSALLMLIKEYPSHKEKVYEVLERELADFSYIKEITTLDEHSSEYVQAKEIYEIAKSRKQS